MTPAGKNTLARNILELIWKKSGLSAQISRRVRVTLQSEGEGEEALRLRDLASQSLSGTQTAYQSAA
jgi:hypothetical protein